MSEQKFKTAKSSLAFSQGLVERMRSEQMAEMPEEQNSIMDVEEMPQEVPQSLEIDDVEEKEEEQKEKTIIDTIKETLTPFVEKIESLLTKKEEPKEAVLKVEGIIEPNKK